MIDTTVNFTDDLDLAADEPIFEGKNPARAQRRHQLARIKTARAKHLLVKRDPGEPPASARIIGLHANTAAICSCSYCGNARKYRGHRSMQELRVMQRMRPYATNV